MEDRIGGTTFLGDGGRGGHAAGPLQRTYLAESSAEMSSKVENMYWRVSTSQVILAPTKPPVHNF